MTMILDSGCRRNVAGPRWHAAMREACAEAGLTPVKREIGETFKCGDGEISAPQDAPVIIAGFGRYGQIVGRLLSANGLAVSNAVLGAMQPLSSYDDDFAGGALGPGWQIHNPALLQHTVAGGELHVRPLAGGPAATWFANGEGPLVYRVVRGDFTVTAQVRSYRLSNPLLPPPSNYDMGGLTLRDPASDQGPNDWLHVAVGGGVPATPIVVEDKSTNDGQSDLLLHPIAAPTGQIRATRQGTTIGLWYRANATAAWQLLRSHVRPDLGPELQVGINVFSWSPTVDVGASFDWITFTRP